MQAVNGPFNGALRRHGEGSFRGNGFVRGLGDPVNLLVPAAAAAMSQQEDAAFGGWGLTAGQDPEEQKNGEEDSHGEGAFFQKVDCAALGQKYRVSL